jgi:hypothetical protein
MEKTKILPFLARIDHRGRLQIPKKILEGIDRDQMYVVTVEQKT